MKTQGIKVIMLNTLPTKMTVERVYQYDSDRKGNSDMERNTVKEYTIRTATEEESDSIITLLKEVAQWLQYKRRISGSIF